MGGYDDREEEKALKEDEQSHFEKLGENTNRLAMNIKPELCSDAIETTRFDLAAEDQAAAKIMGKEIQGFDEGTIGPGLTTDSESLQETWQVDNQPEDKGTAVDTAVPKRSDDTDTYTSSQETNRHGHPQYWVDTKRISDNQPSNEAESLPQQVKTGFHVWTGQHGVPVSVRQ